MERTRSQGAGRNSLVPVKSPLLKGALSSKFSTLLGIKRSMYRVRTAYGGGRAAAHAATPKPQLPDTETQEEIMRKALNCGARLTKAELSKIEFAYDRFGPLSLINIEDFLASMSVKMSHKQVVEMIQSNPEICSFLPETGALSPTAASGGNERSTPHIKISMPAETTHLNSPLNPRNSPGLSFLAVPQHTAEPPSALTLRKVSTPPALKLLTEQTDIAKLTIVDPTAPVAKDHAVAPTANVHPDLKSQLPLSFVTAIMRLAKAEVQKKCAVTDTEEAFFSCCSLSDQQHSSKEEQQRDDKGRKTTTAKAITEQCAQYQLSIDSNLFEPAGSKSLLARKRDLAGILDDNDTVVSLDDFNKLFAPDADIDHWRRAPESAAADRKLTMKVIRRVFSKVPYSEKDLELFNTECSDATEEYNKTIALLGDAAMVRHHLRQLTTPGDPRLGPLESAFCAPVEWQESEDDEEMPTTALNFQSSAPPAVSWGADVDISKTKKKTVRRLIDQNESAEENEIATGAGAFFPSKRRGSKRLCHITDEKATPGDQFLMKVEEQRKVVEEREKEVSHGLKMGQPGKVKVGVYNSFRYPLKTADRKALHHHIAAGGTLQQLSLALLQSRQQPVGGSTVGSRTNSVVSSDEAPPVLSRRTSPSITPRMAGQPLSDRASSSIDNTAPKPKQHISAAARAAMAAERLLGHHKLHPGVSLLASREKLKKLMREKQQLSQHLEQRREIQLQQVGLL